MDTVVQECTWGQRYRLDRICRLGAQQGSHGISLQLWQICLRQIMHTIAAASKESQV